MSARLHIESASWEPYEAQAGDPGKKLSEIRIEALVRNMETNNLVAPLRDLNTERQGVNDQTEEKRLAALAVHDRWSALLQERELLQTDIKRGRECLRQVEDELAGMRTRLEDWTKFERHCGRNPLVDYVHAISAHERIQAFLPGWLRRREQKLNSIAQELELCARQNGLEHLL